MPPIGASNLTIKSKAAPPPNANIAEENMRLCVSSSQQGSLSPLASDAE